MTRPWAENGYAYGYDLMPWQTHIDYLPGLISATVDGSESLRFCCPWYVKGMGLLTLSTGCLALRERPYCLPLEMARSKIGSVRGQIYDWTQAGLTIPPTVEEHVRIATASLGKAVRIMAEINSLLTLDNVSLEKKGSASYKGLFSPSDPNKPFSKGQYPLSPNGIPLSFAAIQPRKADKTSGETPQTLETQSPLLVYSEKFSELFLESVKSLQYSLQAANTLVQAYAQRRLALSISNKTLAQIGCSVGEIVPSEAFTKIFASIFQIARIDINWRKLDQDPGYRQTCMNQLAWSRKNRIKCAVGPLLRFEYEYLPEWLALYSDDWESVCDYVRTYVSECVEIFGKDADYWYAASKINVNTIRGWNEEKRAQLTAVVLDELQKQEVTGEIGLCLSQPYDESMSRTNGCFTAAYYADVLFTSGLKLDFIELELNLGFLGDGSHDRDPLQFSKTLDSWVASGVPISLSLCVPSQSFPVKEKPSVQTPYFNNWSPELQTACVKRCINMFAVKPKIKSVIWNTLLDPMDGGLLATGLFDSAGRPKPALQPFIQMYKWRHTTLVESKSAEKTK